MKKRLMKFEPTYFRLCHKCLHLNESDTAVLRCGRCHKSLGSLTANQYSAGLPVALQLEPDLQRGIWSEEDDEDLDESTTRRPVPLAGLSAIF